MYVKGQVLIRKALLLGFCSHFKTLEVNLRSGNSESKVRQ